MAIATKTQERMIRLIPLTVTMLSLMLLVKLNEVYIGSKELRELYSVREATAEDKKPDEKAADAKAGGDAKADAKTEAKPEDSKDAKSTADAKVADAKTADVKPTDAKSSDAKTADTKASDAKPAEKTADASSADIKDEKKDKKKEEASGSSEKKDGKKAPEEQKTYGTGKSTVKQIEALKARDSQPLYTQTEVDLLQNLAKRRDELDQREKDIEIKAKVLEATEKRINDKVGEMKTLGTELSKVIAQYNQKEDDQIKSLVKIYENMKPDEAANIFNEMEMPILLEVISKMSERKVAPVLANMSPKKAKDVTQELAEKRKRLEMGLGQASAGK